MSSAPAARRSCILLLAAVACTKAPAKPPRAPVSVLVTTVRRAAVPFDVEANGTVTPLQTSNVAAQVDGLITDVAFREGQEVVKGQVLFRIDPRPYQAALDQAQAVLARDRAGADVAQEEATRYETLMKGGYATREEASLRRASALSALATVDVDKAQLANARFNLDNTTVRAPIAGRTGAFLLRAGNLVRAAGGQPLVVIHQVRPILVRFAVPGAMLPLILRYGGKGGLAVTAAPSGASSAGPGGADRRDSAMNRRPADSTAGPRQVVVDKPAESGDGAGTLTFIDNAVDTTTGTVQLKASFENRGGTLWVGQFVSTILRLFTETDALVVPNQAVLTSQRGSYVWILDSAQAAQQRPVRVERTAGGMSVIASGLREGERVITDGQSRLTPGAPVEVRSAADTAGGGGGGRKGGGKGGGKAGATAAGKAGATAAGKSTPAP